MHRVSNGTWAPTVLVLLQPVRPEDGVVADLRLAPLAQVGRVRCARRLQGRTISQKVFGLVAGLVCLFVGTWLLTLNPFTAPSLFWGPLIFAWTFMTTTDSDTVGVGTSPQSAQAVSGG